MTTVHRTIIAALAGAALGAPPSAAQSQVKTAPAGAALEAGLTPAGALPTAPAFPGASLTPLPGLLPEAGLLPLPQAPAALPMEPAPDFEGGALDDDFGRSSRLLAQQLAEQEIPSVPVEEVRGFVERLPEALTPEQANAGRTILERHQKIINTTYFFRDRDVWKLEIEPTIEEAIDHQIASGRKELVLKSAGSSKGKEAYSLALLAAHGLKRRQEDPAAWKVRVEAYDFNPANLLQTSLGLYESPPEDYVGYFEKYKGWYRAAPLLRGWIAPVLIDFKDREQWGKLAEHRGQLLLHRYVHPYLPRGLQDDLIAFLEAGTWTDGGPAALLYTHLAGLPLHMERGISRFGPPKPPPPPGPLRRLLGRILRRNK